MFCPGCGKESLDDRRFCSNCGTNLQVVKQAVTGTLQPQNQPQQLPLEELTKMEKSRRRCTSAGFILIGLGIIYSILMAIAEEIVRNFSWEASRILENLIPFCSIFFIIGIMTMIYGRIMYKLPKNQHIVVVNSVTNAQPMIQEPPVNKAALPAGEIYPSYNFTPPSVTEHTTAQLKQPQPQSAKAKTS